MTFNKPIRRIAIVGTGVIGASWAAQYLARGFDVIATDPALNAEANLRKYVDDAWEQLTAIGLSPGATRERLSFTSSLTNAVSKADLVQENGPERPDFKVKLFAEMDEATPADSIIACIQARVPRLSRPEVSGVCPVAIARTKAASVPARSIAGSAGSFTRRAALPSLRTVTRSSLVSVPPRPVQAISPPAHSMRHSPAQAVCGAGLTQLPR